MKKQSKMSKRTAALMIAAVLLLAGGTVAGTRAALNVRSQVFDAHFYLSHLQVHLLENGEDVCSRAGHKNDLDGEDKVTGELATKLGYEHKDGKDEVLGSAEPGMAYEERIQAQNGSDVDQFVRMTVRKYWMKDGEKVADLRNDRIKLYYENGKEEGYNTSAWTENEAERTSESRTYYYKNVLGSEETTDELFRYLKIDAEIKDLGTMTTEESSDGNKTVYTYEYQYDGVTFYIEADVQAIQTHNVNDAIRSQWGVDNVTATYDDSTGSGSLTVSN